MNPVLTGQQLCISTDNSKLGELMDLIKTGDQRALGDLYDASVGRVYARALRITGNTADADEVTGDVYFQLWRTAHFFDASRGNAVQWLMALVRNRSIDYCRRRRTQRLAADWEDMDALPSAEQELITEQSMQQDVVMRLRIALKRLSVVQLRLIGLAYYDGLSHAQIAMCTELPLGTAKSHLRRALLSLREALLEPPECSARSGDRGRKDVHCLKAFSTTFEC